MIMPRANIALSFAGKEAADILLEKFHYSRYNIIEKFCGRTYGGTLLV